MAVARLFPWILSWSALPTEPEGGDGSRALPRRSLLPHQRPDADPAVIARALRFFVADGAELLEMAPERDVSLSDSIASSFAQYAWPGNLRQLANALRTACALLDEGETQVSWQHLPDDLVEEFKRPAPWMSGAVGAPASETLQELSVAVIARTISASRGNVPRQRGVWGSAAIPSIKQLKSGHSLPAGVVGALASVVIRSWRLPRQRSRTGKPDGA